MPTVGALSTQCTVVSHESHQSPVTDFLSFCQLVYSLHCTNTADIIVEMLIELLLFIALVFTALYRYVTKHFGYFSKHGVPEERGTFPFGSETAWKTYTKGQSFLKFFDESNRKYKNEKMYGVYHFGQRTLVVTDLELAKRIAIKDADHFVDRVSFGLNFKDAVTETDKMFALFLTNMTGEEWKKVRFCSLSRWMRNDISDEGDSQPCLHQRQAEANGASH